MKMETKLAFKIPAKRWGGERNAAVVRVEDSGEPPRFVVHDQNAWLSETLTTSVYTWPAKRWSIVRAKAVFREIDLYIRNSEKCIFNLTLCPSG